MSNHAHRRRGAPVADYVAPQSRARKALNWVRWFLGPSQGKDSFPHRRTATSRMDAAIRASYYKSGRWQK